MPNDPDAPHDNPPRPAGGWDPATAHHEAGHAVAALLLGRPVQRVSVLPGRDMLGWCKFGKGVFRPNEDWVERELLIALAGMVAEETFTGDAELAEAGARLDLRHARKLASQRWGERGAERLIRRMQQKAGNLILGETEWKAVEALAAELLARGEISGRAAEHFLRQVLPKA